MTVPSTTRPEPRSPLDPHDPADRAAFHPEEASFVAPPLPAGRLRALWNAIVAGIGALVGLTPHVLHHVGFLAGSALIAGAGGTILFGVVGLVASVPFLLRLRRRFGTWRAPALALGIFAAMFTVSALVIGPAIDSPGGTSRAPAPAVEHRTPASAVDHDGHHG